MSSSAAYEVKPRAVPLAHHPGDAVVRPPTAGRLSAWHCESARGSAPAGPVLRMQWCAGRRAATTGVTQMSPTRSLVVREPER